MVYFPYEKKREHQQEIIDKVLEAIETKKHLIMHAPTGLGKTAAVLAPALTKAIEDDKTVFFLTSRYTQHKLALETLQTIKEKYKLDFLTVDFMGKKSMCLQNTKVKDFYLYCNSLKEQGLCKFYDNARGKRDVSLDIAAKGLLKFCKYHELCPFELACAIAKNKKTRTIVADYYHIINPQIRKVFLEKINKRLENSIIIFDEAHNLPQRARNLLTTAISNYGLWRLIKGFKELEGFEHINELLNELKNSIENLQCRDEALVKIEDFKADPEIIREFEGAVEALESLSLDEKLIDLLGRFTNVVNFLRNWNVNDKSGAFVRIVSKENFNDKEVVTLRNKCLDPSTLFANLSQTMLFMSGTLTPTSMYKDLLGLNDAATTEFLNIFPKENRLNIIFPKTTTKYEQRSDKQYEEIARISGDIINNIPSRVLVFFPSYELCHSIGAFLINYCDKAIIYESRVDKLGKEIILKEFKESERSVLLAVSSGSFAEGVDLPGLVKGVIVIGIPLTRPDLETKELVKYYENKFGMGWEYGYIYPAILKALQNAGRCIRSEHDRGVIVFMDERYAWNNYLKCFPRDLNIKITREPLGMIRGFFNNKGI